MAGIHPDRHRVHLETPPVPTAGRYLCVQTDHQLSQSTQRGGCLQNRSALRRSPHPEGNNFSKQLIFASSNHQNPALRPKLDVCWRLPSSAVADAQHLEPGFAVYPNPGTDEVLVERTDENPAWLQVFASDGRLVQTHRLSGLLDRMAVGNLPKGLYFFRLETGGWVKWVRG